MSIFHHFYKGGKVCNCLFAFMHTKFLWKRCRLLKERTCSPIQGVKFFPFKEAGNELFPFRIDSFSELLQKNFESVFSPQSLFNKPHSETYLHITKICLFKYIENLTPKK